MRLTEVTFHRVGHWAALPPLSLGPRVTLVLGDNEAGKSTAMRAIEALLFGPTRDLVLPLTTDQLFHASARAALADGSLVEWTWRDRALSPPEAARALRALFPPDTASRFHDLFRIGHADVRADAQHFLSERGAIGQVLFAASAGAGAAGLAHVEDELRQRLKDAKSSAAAKEGLDWRLARCRELKAQLDAAARFEAHDAKHRELEELSAREQDLARQVEDKRLACERLSALRRGLPAHVEVEAARKALAELETRGPIPSAAWMAEIEPVLRRLIAARESCADADERLSRAERALADLPQVPALFRFAQSIEGLASRTDGLDKDQRALSAAERELESARVGLRALLADVGLSPLDDKLVAAAREIRIPGQRRTMLQGLLERREEIESRLGAAREAEDAARRRAQQAEAAASRAREVPVESLERAQELVGDLVQAERDLEKLAGEATEAREAAREISSELGLGGDLDAASALAVPERSALARASEALADSEEAARDAGKALEKARKAAREARRNADDLRAKADAPSEEDLRRTREARDAAWDELKATWTPKWHPSAAERLGPLGESVERQIAEADKVADDRFAEAERIGQINEAESAAKAKEAEVAEAEKLSKSAGKSFEREQERWAALWPFLKAPPSEFKAWLKQHAELRKQADLAGRLDTEVKTAKKARERLLGDVIALLADSFPAAQGLKSAAALKAEVKAELERRKELNQEARGLAAQAETQAKNLEHACEKHEAARRELERWQRDWEATGVPAIAAGVDPTPHGVRHWVDQQDRLARLLGEVDKQEAEAKSRREELDAFRREADALWDSLRAADPELAAFAALPPRDRVAELARLAKDAVRLDQERSATSKSVESIKKELQEKRGALEALQARVAALGDEERCEEEIARAKQGHALQSRIEAGGEALRRDWPMGIEAAVAEIAGRSDAELDTAAQGLQGSRETLESQWKEALRARLAAENALATLTGSLNAAVAAQDLAIEEAKALEKADEVMVLRAALWLLEKAKERASESAWPLLEDASKHFATMTGGAYERLVIDRTQKEPILLAIPAAGLEKKTGALSDGTADQIWLSLRLAVALKAAEETPFPLVLDDVLVHFDDVRATAALQLLGELSKRLQVIVFTHHDHVVDLARRAVPEALEVVTLARPEAPKAERLVAESHRHERPPAPEAAPTEEPPRRRPRR